MVAQNNGKIYKVQNIAGDKIYIGSTNKKYLSQRMDTHRSDYKQWKKENHSHVRAFDIFDEFGIENCVILLIENYPCGSKDELNSREGHFIQTMECVNKNIPGQTRKEYLEKNKDKIAEYNKNRYEDNKDQLIEKQNLYDKNHIDEKKKYQETNKEKISIRNKLYYQAKKQAKLN